MKAKHVRDHVSGYGKNLFKATNKSFGINNALIVRAAMGDEKALTQITDMGKTGERLKMAMPAIKDHLLNYIGGTEEYNKTIAEIYKTGGKSAFNIDKAGSELAIENTKVQNLIDEYTQSITAKLEAESIRHGAEKDMISLQAWVDAQMKEVDTQARFEQTSNRPMMSQMVADEQYETQKINHLLQHGSNSDLSLIPRKNYVKNPVRQAWDNVRDFFS
jgi:hypothetical protein